MRRTSRLLIAALFLQLFAGGVSAEAAPAPLRISGVAVNGIVATVKWNPVKLTSKDFFEVEFSKTSTAKTYKVIKTKSNAIVAKLDPFTQYTVRIRKSLTPKVWSPLRTFTIMSEPVSGLTASNVGYTTSELSWNPVPGANAYDILLNDSLLVSVTTTKYTLTNLKPGSKNSVAVRAKAGLVLGSTSPASSIITLNDAPAKLVASGITTSGSTLSWEPVAGADSYNIYADKTLLFNSKTTTYNVSGLLPGTAVKYSVSAVFGKNETPLSEAIEVTSLIDTPASPTISSITSSTFLASWTIDKNASSYQVVLYDSTGKSEILTKSVDGSLSSTTFSGLTTQTNYTVGIKNIYTSSASKQSALATLVTTKPSITGVVISNVTTVSSTLNWFPMQGVLSYEVYRDGVMIPQATSALTTASVSYTFVGLAPGATYKFSIRATYQDGNKTLTYTDFVDVTQTLVTDPAFAPTSTSVPVITLPYANVPIVGATLSASTGLWTSTPTITSYSYQWQRSLDAGSTWANLVGETRATYKVVASDYAFRLRVRVTATNLNGSTTASSATSSAVVESFNVQIPVVRGILVSGQLLEVTDGTWSSDYPLTFRYQWKRDGVSISGENSPSYTLADTDINKTISVSVIANSTLGSVTSDSTVRTSVAAAGNTVAPVISGAVRAFSTLSTTAGTWLKSPTITYQWQRSTDGVLWNNILSATDSTYVISVDDVGYFIRSQVFGARTVSSVDYKYTSPSLATVIVPALVAVSTSAPVVTGSWTTGSTLSASSGTWTSSGTFTYQWQSSSDNSTWSSISGATSSSYSLVSADASKYIRVQVYLTGSSGADGVAYSVPTAKVGAPYNTLAPAISGVLRVGVEQSVTTGTWSGSPTFLYQWQTSSDGIAWANVSSATNSTYTPTFAVANLRLRVVVSAVNSVDTATARSQVIQGFLAPIATAIPAITGTVQSGQTLTTGNGTWPGSPGTFTYAWHRSSDGGTTWTNIGGATASTYSAVAGDVGYQIRSQVTVTTNAGSSTAYSLPTVPVAP
jgi:large repetitive protein